MRVYRTLIITVFVLSIFVQTKSLFAVSENVDYTTLSNNLTSKTKEVLIQTEVNFKKAVDTLSQKKFILKNQAAVTAVETQVAVQKIGLWQKMINSIATPLVPLFTPKTDVAVDQVVSKTTDKGVVIPVKKPVDEVAPLETAVKVVAPQVIAPVIRNARVGVLAPEIAKLRAEMSALNDATRQYARDLDDQKVNSLARSIDRNFTPVVQQINNIVNTPVVTAGNFNFSETVDGLEYAGGVLSTTVGYAVPLTASSSEWATFYQTPSSRIAAGSNCSWIGNTFNCVGGAGGATTTINGTNGPTFAFGTSSSGTDFNIATSSGTITFNIPTVSATARGLLSSLDFARIPLTASSSEWATFYQTPSTRIAAGANLAWVGNTLGFSGVLPISNGGTATSAAPTYGKLLMGNAGGTYDLVATSSLGITGGGSGIVNSATLGQVAFYNASGTTVSGTSTLFISTDSSVGVGTTTPGATLAVTGTILGQTINTYGTGTSTLAGGVNLTSGCYAINGTCVGGTGGSGTVGSGTTGQFPYYAANGTTLTATSTLFVSAVGNIGIGTVSPSYSLHVRRDQNAGTIAMVQNSTSGTGAFAQSIYQTASESFQVGISSAGYTPGGGAELFGQNTSWLIGSSAGGVNMVASNASGVIRFGTGGYATANERMRITSAGLVGIGTSSPAYTLAVAGDINYTGGIYKNGVLQSFSVSGSGTTGQFPYYAANGTTLTATSTLFVSAVGNIGIGTVSPSYSLHVRRDQNAGTIAMVQNSTSGTGAFAQSIYQTPSDSFQVGISSAGYTPGGGAELFGQNTSWLIGSSAGGVNMVASNASGVIRFGTGGYATANERMRITSTGLVGIGSTTPQGVLTVQNVGSGHSFIVEDQAGDTTPFFISAGGYAVSGHNDTLGTSEFQAGHQTGGVYQAFRIDGTTNAEDILGFFSFGTTDGARSGLAGMKGIAAEAISAGNEGTGLGFFTTPITGSANTERLRITAAGDVGIGTTTPTATLTVVGNARFTAVTSGAYSSDLNITSDGTLTTSASDIRLKENITEISTSTLDKLRSLKAYTFTWKTDPDHRLDVGLIAQEVEFVFPELVFTNKTDGFKGVNYSRLSIFLLKGIQEQQIQLDELKKYTTVLKLKELHTEKLCVGTEEDELCITKEDLQNLLQGRTTPSNSSGSTTVTPSTDPEPTDTGSSTPPTEEEVTPPADTPVDIPADMPAETQPEPTPAPTPEPAPEPTPTPTE